ncbi:hypothetical protein HDV04_005569 [Boothiomyces sp. JEL0838]|nr:hypothetical protein HDV04_005569 [Boothiomyces sp. JEL0838]
MTTDNNQKPKRKRPSHSLIEKKRRQAQNDCLDKLKFLVPTCNTSEGEPLHKLTILERSVEYISYLHKTYNLSPVLPEDTLKSTDTTPEPQSSMSIDNLLS